jgi:hypothetical protein
MASRCLGDNCQSSALYGPVGSDQVRLGGVSVQCGLVRCSTVWWNDRENAQLSKRGAAWSNGRYPQRARRDARGCASLTVRLNTYSWGHGGGSPIVCVGTGSPATPSSSASSPRTPWPIAMSWPWTYAGTAVPPGFPRGTSRPILATWPRPPPCMPSSTPPGSASAWAAAWWPSSHCMTIGWSTGWWCWSRCYTCRPRTGWRRPSESATRRPTPPPTRQWPRWQSPSACPRRAGP